VAAGQSGQCRQCAAGRLAPRTDPIGVDAVGGREPTQVVDSGEHVVELRREGRLTGESIVDSGHRDARGNQTIKNRIPRVRLRKMPAITGVEAAAVNPHDQRRPVRRRRVRGIRRTGRNVQIEE
jgi:hypothetical protein